MTNTEIKKQLHQYIDLLEDETQLNILNETAEAYISNHNGSDTLSEEQIARLKKSIKEADEGKVISNDEMNKRIKGWLTK
jgi:predicted transcriptional regulator